MKTLDPFSKWLNLLKFSLYLSFSSVSLYLFSASQKAFLFKKETTKCLPSMNFMYFIFLIKTLLRFLSENFLFLIGGPSENFILFFLFYCYIQICFSSKFFCFSFGPISTTLIMELKAVD